jgi:hypothetical protein
MQQGYPQAPFLPGAGPPVEVRVEGSSGDVSFRFGTRHGPMIKQCALPCNTTLPSGPYVVSLGGDGVTKWSGTLGINDKSTLYATTGSTALQGLGIAGVVVGGSALVTGATMVALFTDAVGALSVSMTVMLAAGVGLTVLSPFLLVAAKSRVGVQASADQARSTLHIGGLVVGSTGVLIAASSFAAFLAMNGHIGALKLGNYTYSGGQYDLIAAAGTDRAIGIALVATGAIFIGAGLALAIPFWGESKAQVTLAPTLGGLQLAGSF